MIVSKTYLVLNIIVILSGGYLFFDVHQTVSRGTIISFWLCIVPPFFAVLLYALSIAKRNFFGADDDAGGQTMKFPMAIFIISGVFMMWYANPFIRNVDRPMSIIWIVAIFVGVIVPIALFVIYDKWGKACGGLFKWLGFSIFGACFLLGTFLSANYVLDTSEPVIIQQRVVSARRQSVDSSSFYVTVADDAGSRKRLRTSSTVYRHSRENVGGAIYLVTRRGAFGVTYRRLAVVGDGSGGVDRLR